jgi:hypothetical protein
MGGACSANEKNACKLVVGKPERRRPLGRPRRRWMKCINTNLGDGMVWAELLWLKIRA